MRKARQTATAWRDLPPGARPTFLERLAVDQASKGARLRFFALTCLVAGVVTAGLALPVVGGFTALAAHQASTFDDLPADLSAPALPERSELYDSTGKVKIATLHGAEDRVSVSISQVPEVMQQAIIAIEDARFYEHHGVDLKGIIRAVLKNSSGDSVQGASTITQQYVKNVLIEKATTTAEAKAAQARSADRKIREARYALELEHHLSKSQILERYLNIAYFGQGVYGVGTAATHYFGVTVDKLTLPQAALLAGLVNNPSGNDPALHPKASSDRRTAVLNAMVKQKFITPEQESAAIATPLVPAKSQALQTQDPDACVGTVAPYFCAYVRAQLLADPRLGSTQDAREDKLFNGGLHIITTLDLKAQDAAQKAVDGTLSRSNKASAIDTIVEPGTGHVLAMAVNRTYGSKKAGTTDNKLQLFSQPTFQGGSTFKLFTLAAALQEGIGLATKINAPGCYTSKIFENPKPRGCFSNSDPAEAGIYDLSAGTWDSVNTFYIQLEEKVGVQAVIDMAVKLGISKSVFAGLGVTSGSVTLGSVPKGVAPLELANAYATIAAHGKKCPATGVVSLQAQDQTKILPTVGKCGQVIDAGIADTVSSVLQGVLTQGTAAGKGIGRPAAGKTGTLDSNWAGWFVGFTPQMSTAVVVGDTSQSTQPLGPVTEVDGTIVPRVFGGTIPAAIWQKTMIAALAGRPVFPLPPPSTTVANGAQIAVPDVAGLTRADATAKLEAAGFGVVINQKFSFSDTVPRNSVIESVPGPGLADAGSDVMLIISNGKQPVAPPPTTQPVVPPTDVPPTTTESSAPPPTP